MDDPISKVLNSIKDFLMFFYNKPLHLLLIGLVLTFLGWHYHKTFVIISGFVILVFAIATFLENKYKNNKYKKQIIKYYKNLQGIEKEIIDHCINNNILTYEADLYDDQDYITAIYSLVGKGFGVNINYGGNLLLHQLAFDFIIEYKGKSNTNENGN
ncbi:MAG: hypothetical protein WCY19_02635 [Candidatus Gastranaerophilaceae bacterium]